MGNGCDGTFVALFCFVACELAVYRVHPLAIQCTKSLYRSPSRDNSGAHHRFRYIKRNASSLFYAQTAVVAAGVEQKVATLHTPLFLP